MKDLSKRLLLKPIFLVRNPDENLSEKSAEMIKRIYFVPKSISLFYSNQKSNYLFLCPLSLSFSLCLIKDVGLVAKVNLSHHESYLNSGFDSSLICSHFNEV